jgi:hypothetical protein
MEEYLKMILRHLPMQFADYEANDFVKYLSEAYSENIEKDKYQFAFIAFHMLYMTFCYKIQWFLKAQKNKKIEESIEEFLKSNKKKFINGLFDLSLFNESDTLYHLLHSLGFDIVDTNEHKKCVDIRNNCAHANGKIRYDEKKISDYIEEEIEFMEKIQKKLHKELKKLLEDFLEDNWQKNLILGDFQNFFEENYLSLADLESISIIDLPLFKLKSSTEKIIKQKIIYLLLIFEIQTKIEGENNLFLQKLPILIIDLPEIIKVDKDGEEIEENTNKIIEETLFPLLSILSSEDWKEMSRILKIQ